MRLPFLHRDVAGLYVTETHLHWVVLRRFVRRFEHLQWATEAIEDRDVRGALRRLVERVAPRQAYVATHLDPVHVRYLVLEGPAFDEEDAFTLWLSDQVARQLPPGVDPEGFVLRHEVLDRSDDYTRCLIALAPLDAVEERMSLCRSAGLTLVGLEGVEATLGDTLALHPGFAEGRSTVLLVRDEHASWLGYADGVLQSASLLAAGGDDVEALVEEVEALLLTADPAQAAGRATRLLVTGTQADVVAAHLQALHLKDWSIQEARPLLPSKQPLPMTPQMIPAVALAAAQVLPRRTYVDFLDPEASVLAVQQREKTEAVRAMLMSGGAVLCGFVVLLAAMTFLHVQQARTEVQLLSVADRVAEVELVRRTLRALEAEVRQAERLVVERTHVASLLGRVGGAVPEALWFETVDVGTTDAGALSVSIVGATLAEDHLAHFLKRLEQTHGLKDVRLVYSETIPAPRLYRNAAVHDRALRRFEIVLQRDTTRAEPFRPDDFEAAGAPAGGR